MAAVAKWVGVGMLVGLAMSAVPLELAVLVVPVYLFILAGMTGRAWRTRTLAPLRPWLVMPVGTVLAMTTASLLPLKFMDRVHLDGLDDRCATVGRVLGQLEAHEAAVAPEVLDSQVCFAEPKRTVREALDVLDAQAELKLEYHWCGTGSSLLFGMHPIGGPWLRGSD